MSDITDLGGFLGGDEAPGYATLYVVATAKKVIDVPADGKEPEQSHIGYDFPEPPAGLHVPPEITPAAGDKVACLVRVPIAKKELWIKYAKMSLVGDSKTAAEAAWPTKKAEANFLPETAAGKPRAWKRVKPTPVPIPEEKETPK
jgi:hypothetical protein